MVVIVCVPLLYHSPPGSDFSTLQQPSASSQYPRRGLPSLGRLPSWMQRTSHCCWRGHAASSLQSTNTRKLPLLQHWSQASPTLPCSGFASQLRVVLNGKPVLRSTGAPRTRTRRGTPSAPCQQPPPVHECEPQCPRRSRPCFALLDVGVQKRFRGCSGSMGCGGSRS